MTMLNQLNNWGSTATEVASDLPGDDLLADGQRGTRCIDIQAPPEVVFDFLAQMGFGRAGWYSYDWVDNLGRRSADNLHEEWMVTSAGDSIPGGPIDFVAETVHRPRQLVLDLGNQRLIGHDIGFTLSYQLVPDRQPADGSSEWTRVVSRAVVLVAGPLGSVATWLLLHGDAVMVRRQLLGLKERAEAYVAHRRLE